MIKILLLSLFSILSFAQTQIGLDIDGESAGDQSGFSISISSNGTILAIGAPYNNGNGIGVGSVRVYQNIAGNWTQIGDDIDGEENGDQSGDSVSISSDGTTIAIGASISGGYLGSVRVYQNIAGNWTKIGANIDGEAVGDNNGHSVSLSGDGTILAIGAIYNAGNGVDAGSVRVFQNIAGNWTQIGDDIDGEAAGDYNGYSVSLSSDGTILAIGAIYNDETGNNAGSVRVYQNIADNWTQIGDDINGEAAGDNNGHSVSLSSDGTILAIGSGGNDGGGNNAGSVRVFQNIAGNWTQIGDDINGEAAGDYSGGSVSLSSDGAILAIGAMYNDGAGYNAGSVRVYQNIAGNWTKISSDIDGEATGDYSGVSVSLSNDGNNIAIGAYFNDGNGNTSGHVRVYDLSSILSSNNFVQSNFSVYPNPTSETLTIELENNLTLEKVNIYNTLGQIIKTESNTNINVSKLQKGTYFVEVITNQGRATKSIIIN